MELQLTQADYDFIEMIKCEISDSCAIPFELPDERLPQIIYKSALWFYEWYMDATEERWVYVNASDFIYETDNPILLFNGSIEAITTVLHSSSSISTSSYFYIRNPLIDIGTAGYYSKRNLDPNFYRSNYNKKIYSVSNSIAQMYEYSLYDQLFKEKVIFNFNRNTQKMVATNIKNKGSLAIQALVRIPLADGLYNDHNFINYVVAHGKKSLHGILGAFNFQLPGEVTINYDMFRSEGIETMQKIEEDIKSSQNMDFTYKS